ncbi:MAG: hypothetical protein Rsou_0126 [Candidatus Ruthia sp. Asou_11_S2]|nr:hypothetical protein [Candidatus Ruthia sp. Asou_11_S2]
MGLYSLSLAVLIRLLLLKGFLGWVLIVVDFSVLLGWVIWVNIDEMLLLG